MTRVIDEKTLYEIALNLVKRSSIGIAPDALVLLKKAYLTEKNPVAKKMLETMIRNVEVSVEKNIPVCQSPGFPVVYVKMGSIKLNTNIEKVFQKAIAKLTKEGYLRPSIVHPITRKNTGDNSGKGVPDIEIEIDPDSEYTEILVSFKGCGAELPNTAKVLTPAEVGENGIGIKRLVLESVVNACGIPCPPVAIGIGIGGQLHCAAKLSRKAVSIREWTDVNPDRELAEMELELLRLVNSLGIGPAGIGGDTTALTVKIGMAYTHTAICPVVVNFHCWVARRSTVRLFPDGSVVFREDEYREKHRDVLGNAL